MKYLQLFENWLNEAETGKSEVKPFDPTKPNDTLIVDVTRKELFADEKNTAKIIQSFLSKSFDKNEKISSPKVSVQKFVADDYPPAAGGFWLVLTQGNSDNKYRVFLKKSAAQELALYDLTKLHDPVYLVTLENRKDWVDEKLKINWDNKTYLLFKDQEDEGDAEDFALNTSWQVVGGASKDEAIIASLGQICALAATQFENANALNDKNSGKPQNIAKTLGYEIPDNYTPGKGVESTK